MYMDEVLRLHGDSLLVFLKFHSDDNLITHEF